jgi:bacillithiol system protein YtxJ
MAASSEPFRPLTSSSEWEEALSQSEEAPVLVFKHSATCSLSAQAHDEVEALAQESDVPVYKVVVQNHRSVSNAVADTLGVRHETPQAIVLDDRTSVFDTSHREVTTETLRNELRRTATA